MKARRFHQRFIVMLDAWELGTYGIGILNGH
jgi:hypothetical protein